MCFFFFGKPDEADAEADEADEVPAWLRDMAASLAVEVKVMQV